MPNSRKDKLQGVVVSLPTFNDENYNLELDKSKFHIKWLIDHGVTEGNAVIMIAGGLGEGYFLDDDEWRGMADTVVQAAEGRVPTCIGLFELSARRAAKKAKCAADAGVDFLQLAPPHYLVPTEEEAFGHFKCVNDAADIGIMAYNIPWAMPKPGFDYSQDLLERFTELENVVGVKWVSYDIKHYANMVVLFADKFNFINNGGIMSIGFRLGMKGFIDFQCNVAPRASLHKWKLIQERRFEELDELEIRTSIEPFIKVVNPEEQGWVGMGEGPTSRLRLQALGMDSGPYFPAQAPLSEAYTNGYLRAVEASGIREWVDWDQSLFDRLDAGGTAAAGGD